MTLFSAVGGSLCSLLAGGGGGVELRFRVLYEPGGSGIIERITEP